MADSLIASSSNSFGPLAQSAEQDSHPFHDVGNEEIEEEIEEVRWRKGPLRGFPLIFRLRF